MATMHWGMKFDHYRGVALSQGYCTILNGDAIRTKVSGHALYIERLAAHQTRGGHYKTVVLSRLHVHYSNIISSVKQLFPSKGL